MALSDSVLGTGRDPLRGTSDTIPLTKGAYPQQNNGDSDEESAEACSFVFVELGINAPWAQGALRPRLRGFSFVYLV